MSSLFHGSSSNYIIVCKWMDASSENYSMNIYSISWARFADVKSIYLKAINQPHLRQHVLWMFYDPNQQLLHYFDDSFGSSRENHVCFTLQPLPTLVEMSNQLDICFCEFLWEQDYSNSIILTANGKNGCPIIFHYLVFYNLLRPFCWALNHVVISLLSLLRVFDMMELLMEIYVNMAPNTSVELQNSWLVENIP